VARGVVAVIEVVHADLLECLDSLPPFDALITDPPYSPHVHENATSAGTGGMGVRERDLGFDALSRDLRGAIVSLAARASRWSCVFSDFEGCYAWMSACERAEYIRTVPWVRWSQPQLSGDRPCTGAEAVLVFHALRDGKAPMRKHWNGPGSLVAFGVDYDAEARTHAPRRALRGKDKHPTEKPLDLMLDLVSWFSDPGELVLDPCAGSGTTALACRLLGRSCLALERDAEWARRAKARASGVLSDRDRLRAAEWCASTSAEASRVPAPKAENGSDVKTWERAQRRESDAIMVRGYLGVAA
jgi:site-specific DNA-methyltransferase (adenine-specific)